MSIAVATKERRLWSRSELRERSFWQLNASFFALLALLVGFGIYLYSVNVSAVAAQAAAFEGGTVNGYVTMFEIGQNSGEVPEPSTLLLVLLTFSYRQTIFAYPSGGGAYVDREGRIVWRSSPAR